MSTFLALGDSYTVGEGVERSETWPYQLARRLRDEGLVLTDPVIVATTGWTAGELLRALPPVPATRFELVTLQVGVNDQYRGRRIDEFAADYGRLLDAVVPFAADSRRLLAISIPDWGVTPFAESRDRAAIGAAIDEFNRTAREEAALRSVRWIDLTPLSRAAADDLALIAADGLHPSAAAYARWVDVLAPEAARILS